MLYVLLAAVVAWAWRQSTSRTVSENSVNSWQARSLSMGNTTLPLFRESVRAALRYERCVHARGQWRALHTPFHLLRALSVFRFFLEAERIVVNGLPVAII